MTLIISVLCGVIVCLFVVNQINVRRLEDANHNLCGQWIDTRQDMVDKWLEERREWQKERQMLLDRIQAPSFAEYTNKVVREKKAEQPQEEEKPVEFIS